MKIVIDGRWLGRTGIGRYVAELIRELATIKSEHEYVILMMPQQYAEWQPPAANFSAVKTHYDVYTWQEQVLLGQQIAGLKPDLVHFTSFNLPISYGGAYVATIHDLTLVHYKNARGAGLKRWLYELKYGAMLQLLKVVTRRAKAIMVPTKYVQGDVAKHYPVAANKMTVTYEATQPELAEPTAVERFEVPERFMMYVGNYYPYKNIGRLVEAFGQSKARLDGVKLILCGKTPYFLDIIKDQVKQAGLEQDVIIVGYATDGELATLYPRAEAYVFPSLCEGFGLPALEAMVHGTPVLAARASCLPEVLGDAAAYFNPLDVADMARQMDAFLADKLLQKRLRQAGPVRAKEYSWQRMAKQTLAVYNKAMK